MHEKWYTPNQYNKIMEFTFCTRTKKTYSVNIWKKYTHCLTTCYEKPT